MVWYDATNSTATTSTFSCERDGYFVVQNYTPIIDPAFYEEMDAAALVKVELAKESARIAAEIKPLPFVPSSYVPRVMRPIRQPPERYAYYQGEGW